MQQKRNTDRIPPHPGMYKLLQSPKSWYNITDFNVGMFHHISTALEASNVHYNTQYTIGLVPLTPPLKISPTRLRSYPRMQKSFRIPIGTPPTQHVEIGRFGAWKTERQEL